MSTTGGTLGAAIGAVVGFMAGGPTGAMYGMQLGMMAGTIVDPPKVQGPRLSDLTVQTSTYGAPIPRTYGTIAITGNIFWVENNSLKETQRSQSGKGGPEVTTYEYFATFAVGLCEGPIDGITRIWVGDKLIYDARPENTGNTEPTDNVIAFADGYTPTAEPGTTSGAYWTLYKGSDSQLPDERMEATLGLGNVSGYPGLAYLVFKDYPLTDHGNSLLSAQVKVEVVQDGTPVAPAPVYICDGRHFIQDPDTLNIFTVDEDTRVIYQFDPHTGDQISSSPVTASTTPLTMNFVYNEWTKEIWLAGYGNEYSGLYDAVVIDPFSGSIIDYVDNGYQGAVSKLGPLIANPFYAAIYQCNWSSIGGGGMALHADSVDQNQLYGISSDAWFTCWHFIPWASQFVISGYESVYTHSVLFYDFRTNRPSLVKSYIDPLSDDPTTNTATSISFAVDKRRRYVYGYRYKLVRFTQSGEADDAPFDVKTDITQISHPINASARVIFDDAHDRVLIVTSSSVYAYDPESYELLESWPSGAYGMIDGYHDIDIGFTRDREWMIVHKPGETPTIGRVPLRTRLGSNQVTLASVVQSELLRSGLLQQSEIDVSALTDDMVRGYRVAGNGSIRNAIEPLQTPWPFDLIQHGYTLKAVERGGASALTIGESTLGATADGKQSAMLTTSREMDSVLPARVSVRYLDADREYDVNEQYAERLNTDGTSVVTFDAPLVLSADEAAQTAEKTLYRTWAARTSLSFELPPSFAAIEPSDVVTVQANDQQITARIEQVEYRADGVIAVQARSDSAAAYLSTAIGQVGESATTFVGSQTGAHCRYLDLPCLTDKTNQPGMLAAIWPYKANDATWRGGTIFRTPDRTEWTAHATMQTPGATAGFAIEALPTGRWDIIDTANVLKVRAFNGSVSSVTEAQLLAGQNWFAVGDDMRWEIVGAKTVEEQPDGTWHLRDLLRGRLATEWARSTHKVGDVVVLLDKNRLVWIDDDINNVGFPYGYKAISNGASIDSTQRYDVFAYFGENTRPHSPCYLNGNRHPTTGEWTLTWTRRAKVGWQWRDNSDVALGEPFEEYMVELYTDATFTTMVKGYTVQTPSCTVTAGDQLTYFGGNVGTLHVRVKQQSVFGEHGRSLYESITRGQ